MEESEKRFRKNEMPGAGKEIPKEETYNKFGDAARKIEIGAIGKHGTFARIPFAEIPNGASVIEGRFVYTIKINPFGGCEKTGANLDENRKLDAGFRVKGSQEVVGKTQQCPKYNYRE